MPLGLHVDCKLRLAQALSDAISRIELRHGKFLERFGAWVALFEAEKVLPSKGKIRDQLVNYIDERPLTEFVVDTLAYELRDEKYVSEGPNIKLPAVERYRDVKAVAERLVATFESLPNNYTLSLRLPKHLDAVIGSDKNVLDLSSNVRIVRATSEFKQIFGLATASDSIRRKLGDQGLLALLTEQPQWEDQALYLQIVATGFIGTYGGSNTHLDALRLLRSFFGLGIALQLFETKIEYTATNPSASLIVHQQKSDGSWELFERLDLSDSLAATLNTLRLGTANGWVDSPEKQQAWSESISKDVRRVLQQEAKAESILLASQWYFDGSYGADELLRYVQSMVVLEIILGDKATSDLMGLNELLRNRCAYLIGNSQEQRADVLQDFKKIYDVRSQIVHRGKHRLTSDERGLLNRLRWMCARVIQKEVDLLSANKKTDLSSPLTS